MMMNNNMYRNRNMNSEQRMPHHMSNRMEGNMDKCSLLKKIDVVCFAIDDCNLYLDTHPCDEEALNCINELIPLKRNLMEKYAQCYGPLTIDSAPPMKKWEWASGPMPWEGGCN